MISIYSSDAALSEFSSANSLLAGKKKDNKKTKSISFVPFLIIFLLTQSDSFIFLASMYFLFNLSNVYFIAACTNIVSQERRIRVMKSSFLEKNHLRISHILLKSYDIYLKMVV